MHRKTLELFMFFPIKKAPLVALFILSLHLKAQTPKKVQFSAATTEVDARLGKNTRRLLGNVVFTHGNAKMYCDSAYFYSDKNALDAFNNVYINQGDTVHLYGDHLYYDGNTRLSKITGHVKLVNRETTLTTSVLDYDIGNSIGYYTHHADIINQENHLESIIGYYYSRQNLFKFIDSVVITNPDYKMYSDTLNYNTKTKTAFFFGPTEIFGDSSYAYCERGWYNTTNDVSQLNRHALVQNKQRTIRGDSLYYEKETGYGRAINNVEITDKEKDILLRGNKSVYYEKSEYARITDQAVFIQAGERDSLFLHADTLLSEVDTSGTKFIKAFHGVRIYKSNLQGKCDSLTYSFADSVIHLYVRPVLWSEENQLSAEYIEIRTENQEPKTMYLDQSAFIVSSEDTSKFDQIKGKNMTCHFRHNQMYRIDVNGNGQTVYYPKDKEGIIGVNKAECSDLIINLVDGKVNSITFLKKPDAILYPLEKAPINELILKGFSWLDDIRPKDKSDIFRKVVEKSGTETKEKRSAKNPK